MNAPRVAVLGGGILGCMIARRLLEANSAVQVTVIDSGLIGTGASMFSAGVHFPVGRSEHVRNLSALSARYYAEALAEVPDLPIYPVDFLLASRPDDAAAVATRCMDLDLLAPDCAPAALAYLHPDFDVWRMGGCHVADVYPLVQRIAYQLRGRGARLLESSKVLQISEQGSGVQVALSTGISLDFDKVVLAPGPWANVAPFGEFTAALGIQIKKVVALHLDCPAELDTALFFPIEDLFLVPLRHRGHWLLSYTCQQWGVTPAECRQASVTEVELESARMLLRRCAPSLAPLVTTGRVFCDAYSPDREPIVAPLGRENRIIFAGATNGAGYRLAPGIAAAVTELLL